jgi:hypothetical protein
MRVALLSIVLGGLIVPLSFAQGGGDKGLTLSNAKMPAVVRRKIEQVVLGFTHGSPDNFGAVAVTIPTDRLEVGPGKRWVWEVIAPQDECGSHANCTIWLFDSVTGALLADDLLGAELDVLNTRHHGWRDIQTSGNISSCEDVTVIYQFDGHRYQHVRTIEDKSNCDP